MRSSKKSQAALEFLILMTILVVILVFSLAFVSERFKRDFLATEHSESYGLLLYLETEFSLAANSEVGYIREIYIPKTIAGKPYNISLSPRYKELTIRTEGIDFVIYIPYPIEGSIAKGKNIIKREETRIYITPATTWP